MIEKKHIIGEYHQQPSAFQKNLHMMKTDPYNFSKIINALVNEDYRLAWLFGTDDCVLSETFGVHAILCPPQKNDWLQISAALPEKNPVYPALTSSIIGAIWFERYLMDMFGIIAEHHPDPRRLVHHENMPLNVHPLRKDFAWNTVLPKENHPWPMQHVEGNGIYEIPVGPIHAGIIEPGHFRFAVAGERIINLEGKLFFTHKGVEKLLEGKSVHEALPFVERISDDSAASHALAFVQTIELICAVGISERAELIRTLFAELERITMHIHDLANIAGMGTGYTIIAAHGFRIKEKLVRLSAALVGNRFWRGMIIPGGVARDLEKFEIQKINDELEEIAIEMNNVLQIALESDGLIERMVGSGILKTEAAKAYGAVGIPARATDIAMDTRADHPYLSYPKLPLKVITKSGGDVFARYLVRVEELKNSFQMIKEICRMLEETKGEIKKEIKVKKGEVLSAVEGWRGEILHYLRLDEHGRIDRMAIRDPSFCNWPLFGEIGPGNIVPDFPLCNKSLNLSYSGNDL